MTTRVGPCEDDFAVSAELPSKAISATALPIGVVLVANLVIGMAMPVRPLHVHQDLGFALGLVAGSSSRPRSSLASGPALSPMRGGRPASTNREETRMWMTVGERRFAVTLANDAAARAFAAQLPLTLDMPDLNGNEKHAELPKALPAKASRPGTIRNGDLMLYGSQTLVVFYVTFDSEYSYTPLGRVDDPADLPQALGPGSAQIVFTKE